MKITIGPYTLTSIETGDFALDGGSMFGVVPKNLWSKTNPPDEQNRIPMTARVLLIQGNGRTILVDSGNGNKFDEKLKSIYKIDNSKHTMIASLQEAGVSASDITDVLQTHLHFDHVGGAVSQTANGKLVPTFPNAKYYVQREHVKWAQNPTEKDRASFMKHDFEPLLAEGLVEELDGEGEFLPGITLNIFNGHTKAMQLPLISDGQNHLLFCADLVPTRAHINIAWGMGYDNFPLTTIEEKKRYIPRAYEEKWMLFLEHDPEAAVVKVESSGRGFNTMII
jgi:glyoxylase-like metal-dependent hydrolase (beta-lactamase superfamily II)